MTTAVRYEHPYAGSLVPMDVKKIGKIPHGGVLEGPQPPDGPNRPSEAGKDRV